ncbi:hypothetical protein RYD26_12245 [Pasteurellaceae bacterium LIM206]|nr:hypothetical protein [Pasteurellaceae bacterium LIM206]
MTKAPLVGKALANAAQKYPLISDIVATAAVNTGYQLSQDKPYNSYELLKAEFSTVFTRGKTLSQQISINTGLSVLGTTDPNEYGWNALGAISGTVASKITSKALLQINLGKENPVLTPLLSSYSNEYLGDAYNIKKE